MFPHEGGDEEESINEDQLAALETMLDENDEEGVEVIREVEEMIDQVNTNIEVLMKEETPVLEKVKNAVKEDNLSTTSTFIPEEKETFRKRQIGGGYGLSR